LAHRVLSAFFWFIYFRYRVRVIIRQTTTLSAKELRMAGVGRLFLPSCIE